MANIGSGYGGGGAGGGENSSGWTSPTRGSHGFAVLLDIEIQDSYVPDNLKLDVDGSVYHIHLFEKPYWEKMGVGGSMSLSKLSYQITERSDSIKGTRTLQLNPLKIGTSDQYQYHEFLNLSGLLQGLGLKASKLSDGKRNFNFIYDLKNSLSLNYIKNVTIKSFSSDGSSDTTSTSFNIGGSGTHIYYVLLQGAGGGGGGADTYYFLANYAASGGGGGAGTAGLLKTTITDTVYNCTINVGRGGSAGSQNNSGSDTSTAGQDGYNTSIHIKNSAGTQIGYGIASGGGGGGNGSNGNVGYGGHSGSSFLYDTGCFEHIATCWGGNGGDGHNVGGATSVSTNTTHIEIKSSMSNGNLYIDTSVGTGGTVGSENHRGGGGGASWLGNGGYY